MTAQLHQHNEDKITFEAKLIDGTAWVQITDKAANQLILFFKPAQIASIMGGLEKVLGELETIAAHLDRDSDSELAPAGVSEQDGVLV